MVHAAVHTRTCLASAHSHTTWNKKMVRRHPDKNAGDETASARFQSISEAYTILMDADKRRFYDETGEVDDVEMNPEEFKEQFQEMMAELMGGDSIMDMVAGMTPDEIKMSPVTFK